MNNFFAMFTKVFHSKTLFFGWGLTALGVLEMLLPQLQVILGPFGCNKYIAYIGIAIVVLRGLTTKPLSEK